MADIFVSHAHADIERAAPIIAALEAHGWSVFSEGKIPVGGNFYEVLREELRAARAVVVLWSNEAVISEWVRDEADVGRKRKILHPARLDEIEMPLGFRNIHTANLVDWRTGVPHGEFDKLIHGLQARLSGKAVSLPEQPATPPRRMKVLLTAGAALAALAVIAGFGQRLLAGRATSEQPGPGAVPSPPADSPGSAVPTTSFEPLPGIELVGTDVDGLTLHGGGARECAVRCQREPRCEAFTFAGDEHLPGAGRCLLKAKVTERLTATERYVSGVVQRAR